MKWVQAQQRIMRKITSGTDLNSLNTSYRRVLAVRHDLSSARYGYNKETGFVVQIGRNSSINIPMSMLKKCYKGLQSYGKYDGKFFRKCYPLQAGDHPCHVHTVGQILVVSGLAKRKGNQYS